MRPRQSFPPESVAVLRQLLGQAERGEDIRRIQAVLIRALDDTPPDRIAAMVGLSVATVRSLHSQFLRHGVACLTDRPGRGGSRRRHLSDATERRILSRFLASAAVGGILNVGEIREAVAAEVGHQVAASTIYRLLARHGWRKVAPRPHHPNRDPAAVEPFKKRSSRSRRTNGDR